MQFVRQSKFRHVYAKSAKREFCLEDIRVTKVSWDSLFCVVNTKFIAIITEGSGGPFTVLPVTKVGRVDKDCPIVDGHRAPCLDLAWCPFNENIIASCSEDCTAKVWHIPDKGLTRSLKEPVIELLGHQKRVGIIIWHPTANNVLLTAGADLKVFLWNVGTGEALIEIAGHPDLIYSIDFNYNGSKIVTTCKDKQIRIIDPRTGRILQQGAGHEGMKAQRAIFLKDGRVFTTGFTKRSERMYALRDEEALDEPIIQEELETSNGALFPLYDPDTNLMYLCGKGDSNIRYFEINNEPPFVHFINVFSTPEPQRGIGFMPKRGLNIMENEIARIYKCTNRGLVEMLQFFVPRKSEQFQQDLYPDTRGTEPAITADDWLSGKNADPILVPLRAEKSNLMDRPKTWSAAKKSTISPAPSPPSISPMNNNNNMSTNNNISTGYNRKVFPDRSSPSVMPDIVSPMSPSREKTEPVMSLRSRFEPKPEPDPPIMRPIRNAPPRSVSELIVETIEAPRQLRGLNSARQSLPSSGKQSFEPMTNGVEPSLLNHRPPTGRRSRTSDFQPINREDSAPGSIFGHSPIAETKNIGLLQISGSEQLNVAELLNDVQKLKLVARRHERRIRQLEEQLYEKEIADLESL